MLIPLGRSWACRHYLLEQLLVDMFLFPLGTEFLCYAVGFVHEFFKTVRCSEQESQVTGIHISSYRVGRHVESRMQVLGLECPFRRGQLDSADGCPCTVPLFHVGLCMNFNVHGRAERCIHQCQFLPVQQPDASIEIGFYQIGMQQCLQFRRYVERTVVDVQQCRSLRALQSCRQCHSREYE